jgi:hypothetical protein
MKFNRFLTCLAPLVLVLSIVNVSSVDAATAPIAKWKMTALAPSTSYATSSIASTNSAGTKVWSVSGSCSMKSGKVITKNTGSCLVKLVVKARGKFATKAFSRRFLIQKSPTFTTIATVPTQPSTTTTLALPYSKRTIENGLGSRMQTDVFVVGSTVYAATRGGGLSISTDGGATFTKRTTANGLGGNTVLGVYVVGSTVYAATANYDGDQGGLSISTDGGATFTNRSTANGLPVNYVGGVSVVGSTVYAATSEVVSISTDGGATFTDLKNSSGVPIWGGAIYVDGPTIYTGSSGSGGLNIVSIVGSSISQQTRKTTDGLGSNTVYGVFASGSKVYAATDGGLSISTDSGATFTNRTTANGLGSFNVRSVYASGSMVYASTSGGLSISTDSGETFTNYTTTSGLASNSVRRVSVIGSKIYIATDLGLSISN